MKLTANQRLFWIGFIVFALDQLTKQAVLRFLGTHEEREVVTGFFKFVHWKNSGAAWSLFSTMDGSSKVLAAVSLVAFFALLYFRKHFGSESRLGQLALGLVFGGILGNFCDRLFLNHVVDFIRFYLRTRSSTICTPPSARSGSRTIRLRWAWTTCLILFAAASSA